MGYESRIYFVRKYGTKCYTKGLENYYISEIIAEITMCKMGYSDEVNQFTKLFDTEIDFTLYLPDSDDEGNEIVKDRVDDSYGVHMKYGDCHKLRKQMKKILKSKDGDYWRFKVLYKMLKAFEEFEDVYVVHYGY